jgi:DNA helicase-2/ATP-dependent DNA helicase PcrA
MDEELYGRLKAWRSGLAVLQGVPAYVVFTDATLTALAERRPEAIAALVDIAGIGPRKLGLYGEAVIALVRGAQPEDLLAEAKNSMINAGSSSDPENVSATEP